MATPEEIKVLKENNNELVQKLQYWKMTAAQRENEKLNLMKENNELRLKLSRLRSIGNVQASDFDAALQSGGKKALALLVKASTEIAQCMQLAKDYLSDRGKLDVASPQWNSIGASPASVKKNKIHRVPPLMMGGQSIQPVVALTMLNTSNPRTVTRTPNPNRNVTQRALPMHVLQDVYIPLTRIDARGAQAQNMGNASNENNDADNSTEDLGLDDNEERVMDDSQPMSEDEDYDSPQRLMAVEEETEQEDEAVTPPRNRIDNPLEGPSWMLDATTSDQGSASKSRTTLEPDSTTELEDGSHDPPDPLVINVTKRKKNNERPLLSVPDRSSCEFSPTIRRRKRIASPPPPVTPRRSAHFSPRTVSSRRISNNGRVLKVVVAKMRLEGDGVTDAGSPPKRAVSLTQLDAPSPNGATVAGVIVSDAVQEADDSLAGGEPRPLARSSLKRPSADHVDNDGDRTDGHADRTDTHTDRTDRHTDRTDRQSSADRSLSRQDDSRSTSLATSRRGSHDSDSGSCGDVSEGRTRRPRRVITYKEKPLNRKMRR